MKLHLKSLTLALLVSGELLCLSCSKEDGPAEVREDNSNAEEVSHDMIVLGRRLEDPYAVENVQKALKSLYPTKADRGDVTPTNVYVRFLPRDEKEFDELLAASLVLIDHPLDYQIVKDGDYYHDPGLSDSTITWQYAVVAPDYHFPEGIRYEVLDQCYIPDNDLTRADDIDWTAVEREAYILTGNEDMLIPVTRAENVHPSGRITIEDENANGGKPFGVSGVRVTCNSFVKFSSDYTDRDGYYEIPKSFSVDIRYRLVFKNEKRFSLGVNLILVPASWSTLGKGDPEGLNVNVTKDSDRKLFTRCVVNNAAYDYITRCGEGDMDIAAPPSDLRIWLLGKLSKSSTVMIHHGAVLDKMLFKKFLDIYKDLIQLFAPDITIGTDGKDDYSSLYSLTVHELAHASHYSQVGNSYWDRFIEYIITAFVTSGGVTYGDGDGAYAGYCEVGEMWAYYMESKLYKERYGGSMPTFGNSFWFYPQIFRYLDERGVTRSEMMKALQADVTSRALLHEKLVTLYPERQTLIDQVFNRYSE